MVYLYYLLENTNSRFKINKIVYFYAESTGDFHTLWLYQSEVWVLSLNRVKFLSKTQKIFQGRLIIDYWKCFHLAQF